jgi:hypothetical protein
VDCGLWINRKIALVLQQRPGVRHGRALVGVARPEDDNEVEREEEDEEEDEKRGAERRARRR